MFGDTKLAHNKVSGIFLVVHTFNVHVAIIECFRLFDF